MSESTFVYVILFLFLFTMGFFNAYINSEKQRKIICIPVVVILVVFSMFRGSIGTDYYTYYEIYSNTVIGATYGYLEPGYLIFMNFISVFTDDPDVFLAIFSLITIFIVIIGLNKNKLDSYTFLFLYLIMFTLTYLFNGIRQAMAMSFFLLMIFYCSNNKFDTASSYIKFLFLACMGASFHITSFLGVIILFIKRIDFRWLWFGVFLSLLLGFLGFGSKIFGVLLPMVSDSFALAYASKDVEPSGMFQILFRLLILVLTYFISSKYLNDELVSISLKSVFIGSMIFFAFKDLNLFSTRIYYFFLIGYPVNISRVIYLTGDINKRLLVFVVAIGVQLIPFYFQINNYDNMLFR